MENEHKITEALQAVQIVQKYLDDEVKESGSSFWRDKQGRGFRTDMGYFFEGLDLFESYLKDILKNGETTSG